MLFFCSKEPLILVVELGKFEYSPLTEANKDKSKTDKRNKIVNTNKQDINLLYNSQNSFAEFKDVSDCEEFSLDSMHKKLNDCHKKFTIFKKLNPQTRKRKI